MPPGSAVPIVAILLGIAVIVVALVIWAISTIARGGLIAGASTYDRGGSSTFGQAWNAGWRKGWRLLGIGLISAVPAIVLAVLGLGAATMLGRVYRFGERTVGVPAGGNLAILVVALACVLIPFALMLTLLRTFADRACMLEDRGVFGSYRRGLQVLLDNLGAAVILFLIQIGIGVAVLGFLPSILLALCCALWPLVILIEGFISAYFSTTWTLAWREWTGPWPTEEGLATASE
jgi:hypothetical protein